VENPRREHVINGNKKILKNKRTKKNSATEKYQLMAIENLFAIRI
jgi:hypothetical protein